MVRSKEKIVIANAYRCKNKQSFFAIHQIYSKIKSYRPDIDIEFHIMWDNTIEGEQDNIEKWEKMIDDSGFNITSYDKKFFIDYASKCYSVNKEDIQQRADRFFSLYHILIPHYLRRVKMYDYYLVYDEDILINYDFKDVVDAILDKRPVMITEPYHQGCDKGMYEKVYNLFGNDFEEIYINKNPNLYGFNGGFQGIDLRMYDEFLSSSGFITLLNLFDYPKVFDEDGNRLIDGYTRTLFETQQQSFFALLNITFSKNELYILDPMTTYVAPNFGYCETHGHISSDDGFNGWSVCLKSNISHFIGHTNGQGKPKEFMDRIDEYLKQNGFM